MHFFFFLSKIFPGVPPLISMIKVNTNDSFTGSIAKEELGLFFATTKGNHLLHFGKQVDVDSAIHVEILALREGFLVATAS